MSVIPTTPFFSKNVHPKITFQNLYKRGHRANKNIYHRSSLSNQEVVAKEMEEGKRVCALVVDDDSLIRKVHWTLLRRYGLEAEAAKNGKEAVDLFLSGKTFDLVLMDMEMPVMDGPKATRELRAMGVSSMIVGVTARGLESEKAEFMAAGLDGVWEKPLNGPAVIAMLDELAKKLL